MSMSMSMSMSGSVRPRLPRPSCAVWCTAAREALVQDDTQIMTWVGQHTGLDGKPAGNGFVCLRRSMGFSCCAVPVQ
jgi:hypothetical protein